VFRYDDLYSHVRSSQKLKHKDPFLHELSKLEGCEFCMISIQWFTALYTRLYADALGSSNL